MTFLAAHAPDGLLAPGGLLGTSHRFLFKIGGRNTTTTTITFLQGGREWFGTADALLPQILLALSYVPLESVRDVFAQPPVPRTAMEQSGHAQEPTLIVALV